MIPTMQDIEESVHRIFREATGTPSVLVEPEFEEPFFCSVGVYIILYYIEYSAKKKKEEETEIPLEIKGVV